MGASGGMKVNSGGWANRLWEKGGFGVCGELWWIFGFCRALLRLRGHLPAFFGIDFCAQNVERSW
jgi:hypothetical protein